MTAGRSTGNSFAAIVFAKTSTSRSLPFCKVMRPEYGRHARRSPPRIPESVRARAPDTQPARRARIGDVGCARRVWRGVLRLVGDPRRSHAVRALYRDADGVDR